MADPFGISFAPTSDGAQPNGGARPSPIQQAIQTLSFKIPRVAGASAFTAQPLLTAQGGDALGGNPNSAALLEQIRRMLFGQQGGQQGGGSDHGGTNFSQLFGMPDTTLTGGPSGGNLGGPSGGTTTGTLIPRIDPSSPPDTMPRDPEIPALPADTTTTTNTGSALQNNFNNGQDRRDRYA